MTDFLPPIDDPFAVSLAKLLLPIAKMRSGLDIKISERCRNVLKDLHGKHAVLMINHSDRYDPLCACALARECNENFYFIASREQFDRQFGFAGWVLQHLGAYSVIRGSKVEAASAKETVSILVQGKHILAQFPEGDVTGRNDKILPLKVDGLQNLFEAQKQLIDSTGESLFVLPVGMYFKVRHDSIQPMTDCLRKLEKALNISSLGGLELTFEQRIKKVVSQYISHLENLYGFVLIHKQSLSAELHELSRKITLMVARATGVQFDPDEDDAVLLYGVRAELRVPPTMCADGHCDFTDRLEQATKKKRELLIRDLDRAEQLLILASTLESEKFTPEVAWRILDRLESDMLGKTSSKGHRTAFIDASNPIDLKPYYLDYANNSSTGLNKIDGQVRTEIYQIMQGLQAHTSEALNV